MHRLPVSLAFAVSLSAAGEEKARTAPEPVKLVWPAKSGNPFRLLASLGRSGGSAVKLTRPCAAAVDTGERIYIADPGQRCVIVYDRKSGAAARWTGNSRCPLSGPVAVALDRSGRLFVADGFTPQVVVFDNSGSAVAAFGGDVLKRPAAIAVDRSNQRVWVSDVRANRVLSFDLGTFAPGPSIDGFSAPSGLAVDSKGRLYVSDMWNCRVLVFTPDGSLARRIATQCAREGEYGRPNSIAVDTADRVYVAEPEGALQVFTADGRPVRYVASLGPASRPETVRTGITVDRQGRMYLVEQAGREGRVQIYSPGLRP